MLTVSILGFLVNLIGLFFFHDLESSEPDFEKKDEDLTKRVNIDTKKTRGGEENSGHSANIYAVYLHVLADALGSIGVIVSSVLIRQYEYYIADPICSILISVMIFVSVLPLIYTSFEALLRSKKDKCEQNLPELKIPNT